MADTKEFRTRFNIGAVWTGQKGVQAAQRSLGGLQQTAQRAHTHFRGMASSVFKGMVAYGVASKAIQGVTDTLVKSISAAQEAQEAHDELGLSIERMAKRYKNTMGKSVAETSRIVEESTQALIAASEQMEKTGHDAETLQKGWAKLAATGALDPQQILAQRDAFSDVLSYMYGANATAEESVQLGEQWADAILRGNIAVLKRMDLTDGEIELLKNVNKQVRKGTITAEEGIKRRQDLVLKFAKKLEGETERVFDRPSGKVAQMWTQIGNIYETLGKPFVDRAGTMAESFGQIAKEVQPIADKLAEITDVKLKALSDWMDKNGPEIPARLTAFFEGLDKVFGVLWKIKDVLQTIEDFQFNAVLKLLNALGGNVPANRMQQLPGSPAAQINPALQQGAAGQRYQGGIKAKPVGTGYAPYQRELDAQAKKTTQAAAQQADAVAKQADAADKQATVATQAVQATQAAPTPAAATQAVQATQAAPPPTPAAATTVANATQATASDVGQAAIAKANDPEYVKKALAESRRQFKQSDPSTWAAVRHKNPGGMWPGEAANRFGSIGQQTLNDAERNKIATFPTPLHGAAANMYNLANKGYVGKTIGSAMQRWSGSKRSLPGPGKKYDINQKITPEMLNDPEFMIPFMQAISGGESSKGKSVMSEAEWQEAYKWYKAGGVPKAKPGGGAPTAAPTAAPLAPGPTKAAAAGQVTAEDAMMHDPRRQGLNRMIKEMNIQQRTAGATGGTNVAMNPTINVNGVAPGREALMAKKTALAMRDPTQQLLAEIRKARAEDNRTNYV